MTCPLCSHPDTRVFRTTERAGRVRRTRQCCRCGHKWATVEIAESEAQRVETVKRLASELIRAIEAA